MLFRLLLPAIIGAVMLRAGQRPPTNIDADRLTEFRQFFESAESVRATTRTGTQYEGKVLSVSQDAFSLAARTGKRHVFEVLQIPTAELGQIVLRHVERDGHGAQVGQRLGLGAGLYAAGPAAMHAGGGLRSWAALVGLPVAGSLLGRELGTRRTQTTLRITRNEAPQSDSSGTHGSQESNRR